MNQKHTIALPDTRTAAQKEFDEKVASGDWDGFEIEELLTQDGADQIIEHCRNLRKELAMDQTTALGSVKGQPFRWKNKVFRVLRCDYVGGQALVEVVPHDEEFIAELKKRVENDRFHTLTYYQGFGFVCFPEDYSKYKDQ
jgi:hypothetical protein